MKNTKKTILSIALQQFNEKGIDGTTLRGIATEMGISQGNLNYHFKTKNALIEALYFDLVEAMDGRMRELDQSVGAMEKLYVASSAGILQMFEYRFILKNFVQLMKDFPVIQKHYAGLQVLRTEQFLAVFKALEQLGYLRKEMFVGEYARMFERMNILGDYWVNYYETDVKKRPVQYYVDLLFESIYPYLTEKGKGAYQAAFNSFPK